MSSIIEAIKQAALDAGEVGFRHSYSGRGMYGKQCIAITGDSRDLRRCIVTVLQMLQEEVLDTVSASGGPTASPAAHDAEWEARDYLEKATDALLRWHEDNMGTRSVYYWPKLEWQGDDTEGEEE